MKKLLVAFLPLLLTACVTVPPVDQSRAALWARYGNKSLDEVLLTWGAPAAETHLTDGTRMITYTRTSIYNFGDYDQSATSCRASFLAPPPKFRINNVSLDGHDYECSELAQGITGTTSSISPRVIYGYSGGWGGYGGYSGYSGWGRW